jgi:AraC-like DNA-binding protein
MGLIRQSDSARGVNGTEEIGGVVVGVLGEVASPRGVRVLAVDGPASVSGKVFMLPDTATFWYSLRMPNNVAVTVGGGPHRVTGQLGFCAAGIPLQVCATGHYTYLTCYLGSDFLGALADTESGLQLGGVDLLHSINSESLVHLSRAAFRASLEPGFCSSVFAETIATAITVELARYKGARRLMDAPRRSGLAPWQMRRLDEYIRAHLSENLTLQELALLLGISVRHLSRAVRQTKGVSLYRWIADCRLAEARRLLGETDFPIAEIALRSAFQSTAAFSAAFHAAVGFAPSEFRRLNLRTPAKA